MTVVFIRRDKGTRHSTCAPNIWEVEAGGLSVPDQPGLYREFKGSLKYIAALCFKKQKNGKEGSTSGGFIKNMALQFLWL
jgi:hypothetical protein